MSISKVDRSMEIDVIKGIGIILVVLLHVGIPSIYWTNFFGSFHMVLFFFCSGYCFHNKHIYKRPYDYIWKKMKQLYIPYVLFNGLTVLLNNFLINIFVYTDREEFLTAEIGGANFFGLTYRLNMRETFQLIKKVLLFNHETQLGGATWFLRVLFFVSIIFYLVYFILVKVSTNTDFIICGHIFFCILFMIVGWKGNCLGLENKYQIYTCCSVYFTYVLGYYMKIIEFKKVFDNVYNLFILLLFSFIVLKEISPMADIGINRNHYINIGILIMVSVFGFIFCFASATVICKIKPMCSLLSYVGQNSLYIMMFHFLSLKIVCYIKIYIEGYPDYYLASFPVLEPTGVWRILYVLVGVFFPIGLVKAILGIFYKYNFGTSKIITLGHFHE